MSVFIFTNLISGVSGLDKSVISTANLLSNANVDTHIINCVGKDGGFLSIQPKFPLSSSVHLHSIQAMAVSGGNALFEKQRGAFIIQQPRLKAAYTKHDLLVTRAINDKIGPRDLIIFTHPLQAVLYAKSIGRNERRARTILQIHGNYTEEHHNRELLLEGLGCIDDLQIVSESMRVGISEIVPFKNDRIHYIPNVHFPIPIERVKTGTFNVAIIGSLQDRKNQIDAVRAVLKVKNPDVKLDIWGNPGSEYGKFIQTYVENVGAGNRVRLKGIGTEEQIYEGTDLVLITSKHEGFGYTMIEAATHGIPTVAYNYQFGADEFIESGVNGYLVQMGDVDQLAARIDELAQNPSLVEDMGVRAGATFREKFSPEHILRLYEKLIPEDRQPHGASFARHFVRDNHVPFAPRSVKVSKRLLFGWHYADEVTFRPVAGQHDLDVVMIRTSGEPKSIKTKKEGGRIVAKIPRYDRFLRRVPPKYLLATKSNDGRLSYLLNTTLTGKIERLQELSRYSLRKDRSFTYAAQNVVLTKAGAHVKYNSYEPVQSVADDDGTPIDFRTNILNWRGNHGPHLTFSGEFSGLNIRYSSGRTIKVCPPSISYKDVYLRLLELEKDHGFLEYELGGIRPWELMRASLLEQLMVGLGHWGPHFDSSSKPAMRYVGSKNISSAPAAERLIFEFTRKGEVDLRTLPLRTGNEVVIEYPQMYGYTVDSYIEGPVYPIDEFHRAVKRVSLASNQKYNSDLFGPIFAKEFGLDIHFKEFVEGRVLKFKKEHYFWTKIFEKVQFGEVVIPSAYWSAGICHAARQKGMLVSDVQYALITSLHPTNTFSGKAAYTPDKIYAWSDYWSRSAKKYSQKEILGRKLPEVDEISERFDFCVMSQPRVKRRIADFLVTLATRFPSKRIAYCLHPDEPIEQVLRDSRISQLSNVHVRRGDTFSVMAHSDICVGGYSTSLYEAAYLGKPSYVIPVPGWEVIEKGIEEGIFRVVNDPEQLVPFEQPQISRDLF